MNRRHARRRNPPRRQRLHLHPPQLRHGRGVGAGACMYVRIYITCILASMVPYVYQPPTSPYNQPTNQPNNQHNTPPPTSARPPRGRHRAGGTARHGVQLQCRHDGRGARRGGGGDPPHLLADPRPGAPPRRVHLRGGHRWVHAERPRGGGAAAVRRGAGGGGGGEADDGGVWRHHRRLLQGRSGHPPWGRARSL